MKDAYQAMKEKGKDDFVPDAEFDKVEWSNNKKKERESTYELIDKAAVQAVDGEIASLDACFDVMARFPNHSVSNNLLIFAQSPEASRIGDSDYWASKGAIIKKGEKAFSILQPGNEYTRDDGSIGVFFDVKKVFDVEQTTAKTRLPRKYDSGDVLLALIETAKIDIVPVEKLEGGQAVYDHETKTIQVLQGLSNDELFKALSTELAHVELAKGQKEYDRGGDNGIAVLSSVLLSKRMGIEASIETCGSYPAFRDHEPETFKAYLNEVRNTSKAIGDRMGDVLNKPKAREAEMAR